MSQLILRPTGAGDETSIPIQYPDSGYHWDKVDEIVSDDMATYVASSVDAQWFRDLYALADTSQTGIINWVRAYIRVYAAAGSARTALKSGSTVYDGAVQTPTPGSWIEYHTQYDTMDGVAWTWAKVNAAQAGQSLTGTGAKESGINCTQAWLVVDFTTGPQTLLPSSIVQALSYGSPKLNLLVKPSSIVQALAYGTPALIQGGLFILPGSIALVSSVGTPSLTFKQFISPPSIIQVVSIGTPLVSYFGIIKPSSIVQQISIGIPLLRKYVWHVILDGQYATETPGINRTYIIGRDQYGYPVYGTAVDSTELGLVGERLDFQQDLAIPLTAQAAEVAAAILSKIRITTKKGLILIPPNCGQELFDVVQISDSGANQSAVKFRVVGIRFEYNPRQARYEHCLLLGAP